MFFVHMISRQKAIKAQPQPQILWADFDIDDGVLVIASQAKFVSRNICQQTKPFVIVLVAKHRMAGRICPRIVRLDVVMLINMGIQFVFVHDIPNKNS